MQEQPNFSFFAAPALVHPILVLLCNFAHLMQHMSGSLYRSDDDKHPYMMNGNWTTLGQTDTCVFLHVYMFPLKGPGGQRAAIRIKQHGGCFGPYRRIQRHSTTVEEADFWRHAKRKYNKQIRSISSEHQVSSAWLEPNTCMPYQLMYYVLHERTKLPMGGLPPRYVSM